MVLITTILNTDRVSEFEEQSRQDIANKDWLDISFEFALLVLVRLKELKWDKDMLANEMNVPIELVNNIVKGRCNLNLETIALLQKTLSIPLIKTMTEYRPSYYNHGEVEPRALFKTYGEDNHYLCTALKYLSRPDKDPSALAKDLDKALTYFNWYKEDYPNRVSPLVTITQRHLTLIELRWKCDMDLFRSFTGINEVNSIQEAKEILILYNKWRRGDSENLEMPNPRLIGLAIDFVIKAL